MKWKLINESDAERDIIAKSVADNGGLFDINGEKEVDDRPRMDKVYYDAKNNFAFKLPARGNLIIYKLKAIRSKNGFIKYGYDIMKVSSNGMLKPIDFKWSDDKQEAQEMWRILTGMRN